MVLTAPSLSIRTTFGCTNSPLALLFHSLPTPLVFDYFFLLPKCELLVSSFRVECRSIKGTRQLDHRVLSESLHVTLNR